jgi:hypothetical protein
LHRLSCRSLAVIAFALLTTTFVSAATSVSIESAAPGSATESGPTVVVVRDLPVPLAGATVIVTGRAQGLAAPTKLATVFIVGNRNLDGNRERTFRSIVEAAPSVIEALAHDPRATITLTVRPTGHPEQTTTAGPYTVNVVYRPHAN